MEPCPLGHSCVSGVSVPCTPGTYSDITGASSCLQCSLGKFGIVTGSTKASDCNPCPIGTYNSIAASSSCTACASGSTTISSASQQPSDCVSISSCENSTTSLCPALLGSIPIKALLPSSTILLERLNTLSQLVSSLNATSVSSVQSDFAVSNAIAALNQPLANTPSLRTASGCCPASTSLSTQTTQPKKFASESGSNVVPIAVFALLIAGFVPWLCFMKTPPRVALFIDQFTTHKVSNGSPIVSYATQFGACFTWAVVCVIALLIIAIVQSSNRMNAYHAVPISTSPYVGARANFEITLRVYSSTQSVQAYCGTVANPNFSSQFFALTKQTGFSVPFTTKSLTASATVSDMVSACTIAADCQDCELSTGISQVRFQLPFDSQLVEYEVWVSSSIPSTWTRRYGLLQQLPGQLLDTQAQLQFSLMESWFRDEPSEAVTSGLDMNWKQYVPVTTQQTSSVGATPIEVDFRFILSDVSFISVSSQKWFTSQIVAVTVSTIAALIMAAGYLFRNFEYYVLGHRAGRILTNHHGTVIGVAKAAADENMLNISSYPSVDEQKQSQAVELLDRSQEEPHHPSQIREQSTSKANTINSTPATAVIHVSQ